MLSFYKWNLHKKSCNSNKSKISGSCARPRLTKMPLFHFAFWYLFGKMYYFMIILTSEIEWKLSKYIPRKIQDSIPSIIPSSSSGVKWEWVFGARDTIVKSNANKLARSWMLCLVCLVLMLWHSLTITTIIIIIIIISAMDRDGEWRNDIPPNDVKTRTEKGSVADRRAPTHTLAAISNNNNNY